MKRRSFLKHAVLTAGLVGAPMLTPACTSVPLRPVPGPGVDKLLRQGARVMWVAAHPDDESMTGGILARASLTYNNPLFFLIFTHGDGGECCRPEGCLPDLATVRGEEMADAAKLYHAELQHERLFNAKLPVESFPKRHEIGKLWKKEKDPELLAAEAIRRFRPDVLFTFDPFHGFTGHPEHQLASRFATSGVRLAASGDPLNSGLPPHRVGHVYYILNKYWPFALFGAQDPGAVNETWDARQLCINGYKCRDIMARFTRIHRTQENDMNMVRTLVGIFDKVYLRKTDPFEEILDPYEPVS